MMWSTTLVLAAILAGCGGSGSSGLASTITQPGAALLGSELRESWNGWQLCYFGKHRNPTDANASVITGNIAVGPGYTSTAITGFALNLPAASPYSTSVQVSGKVYAFDYAPPTPTEVNTASLDMGSAYTAAAAKATAGGGLDYFACPGSSGAMSDVNNELQGFPVGGLPPGVYTCGVNITIPGDLTLNGNATDIWVFKTTGTLAQDAAMKVLLTGGALPQNVFWQVAGAVTVGSTAQFQGIILGKTAVALGNLSSINGRILAQTAVTLDATTVTQP